MLFPLFFLKKQKRWRIERYIQKVKFVTRGRNDSQPVWIHSWKPNSGRRTRQGKKELGYAKLLKYINVVFNSLDSVLSNGKTLMLHDILHMHEIAKNLLKCVKVCSRQQCVFHVSSFLLLVKDMVTKEILLEGKVHQELYVFGLRLQ